MFKLLLTLLDEENKVLGEYSIPLNHEPSPDPDSAALKASEKMTDAQRRFLFRLLSDQGIEGDNARDYLKKQLKVADVKDISKGQASWLIEKLKNGGAP